MNEELLLALEELCEEKGLDKETILDALEAALVAAYKRNFNSAQNVEVQMDREKGGIHVYTQKTVVEEEDYVDPQEEILLEDAKKISGVYNVGDVVNIEVTPRDFGRIAAMTAKQVVTQRLREAERGIIYSEFTEKENDIVSGRISRIERGNVFVDIGKLEAMLPVNEQPSNEKYEIGQMLLCYVSDVRNGTKGTQIMLSRTHPGLVKRLFIREVPEIADGIVEIMGVSREAGSRTKIAVWAEDRNIDPQGACIGPKGARVQAIGDELKDEKIDIVKWSEDPAEFIAASLSPSKVLSVDVDYDEKTAKVTVPENQLSLAIGKSGQNVRLAARLTGWKIDISAK
ncbi:MAG: transcription termination/antitermination protein NusA [Clostridia bacterium]|nr:transcription termination/antitermination protein NusA [Clostridia bacterium]